MLDPSYFFCYNSVYSNETSMHIVLSIRLSPKIDIFDNASFIFLIFYFISFTFVVPFIFQWFELKWTFRLQFF